MPIWFLVTIFLPLVGFWNALIYIRPRYRRYLNEQRQQTGVSENNPSIFEGYLRAVGVDEGYDEGEIADVTSTAFSEGRRVRFEEQRETKKLALYTVLVTFKRIVSKKHESRYLYFALK